MRFQDVLCKLGDVWHISDDLVTDLEELTCDMYRYSILKQKWAILTSANFHYVGRHCLSILDK